MNRELAIRSSEFQEIEKMRRGDELFGMAQKIENRDDKKKMLLTDNLEVLSGNLPQGYDIKPELKIESRTPEIKPKIKKIKKRDKMKRLIPAKKFKKSKGKLRGQKKVKKFEMPQEEIKENDKEMEPEEEEEEIENEELKYDEQGNLDVYDLKNKMETIYGNEEKRKQKIKDIKSYLEEKQED